MTETELKLAAWMKRSRNPGLKNNPRPALRIQVKPAEASKPY
jgi:hypothetical protein